MKHTPMLRRLHELQPDFAFEQTQLREAIALLKKRHPDWRLDENTKCCDAGHCVLTSDGR